MTSRGYVICSYERSGSNLLCAWLGSTQRLGRPQDYFNGPGMRARGDGGYPLDPELQLRRVCEDGATANGVYGLKMFCERFDHCRRVRWAERLPGLQYVHLFRHDLLGQAVSTVRARQTGQYRSSVAPRRSPHYDRRAIERALQALALSRARWALFFARNGIQPLQLEYTEVVEQPQQCATRVARLLGMQDEVVIRPELIALQRQSDALSAEWRARFVRERGDLGILDVAAPSLLSHWRCRLRRWFGDR